MGSSHKRVQKIVKDYSFCKSYPVADVTDILYSHCMGVVRDKSMCRDHCSMGVRGGMPPQKNLISYIVAAAFWTF